MSILSIFSNTKPKASPASQGPAKAPQAAPKSDKTALPYLHARREWDERYGDLLTRARNWQVAALIGMTTAALAVVGIVWIAGQTKIQPFVVAVDQLGNPVAVARPQALARGAQLDERVIRSQLATFITNSRSLLIDVAAQQVLFDRTFAMIDKNLAEMMTVHLRDVLAPAQRDGTTISVQIQSVIPISSDTWQIDWTETPQRVGQSATPEQWRALVTVSLSDEIASDPTRSIWNPFGLVVRQLSWQKVSV